MTLQREEQSREEIRRLEVEAANARSTPSQATPTPSQTNDFHSDRNDDVDTATEKHGHRNVPSAVGGSAGDGVEGDARAVQDQMQAQSEMIAQLKEQVVALSDSRKIYIYMHCIQSES